MENDNPLADLPPSFDEDGKMNQAFENVHTVDMNEAKVIIGNDPDHIHDYKKDPTEDNENFYGEICDCGIGRLVRKKVV